MPIVRDASYFSLMLLKLRADGSKATRLDYPNKPIASGLVAALAYDTPSNILSINQSTLDGWGVGFDKALEIATNNLRDRTLVSGFKQVAPSLYLSEFSDSYDSARLLLPDFLYRLVLDGDPVLFLPNRNQLWVAGRYNRTAIETILKFAPESHFDQGHCLSPCLYLLSEGRISDYVPEDLQQREIANSIRRRRDAIDYAQQTEYLNTIYARDKIDLFVAACTTFKRKDGSCFTMSVWSNGIDTLLPKTDQIGFMIDDTKRDHIRIPWDAAFPIVANLMEVQPDLFPVRYRVRQFPDHDQLDQLRALAKSVS